jgi:hypothetical protein
MLVGRTTARGAALASALAMLGMQAFANPVPIPGTSQHLDVSGYVDGLAVVDTGGGQRQLPQAVGVLRVDGTPTSQLRTHLELRGRMGGPFEGGHQGVFNLVHAFQNHSPALEAREAYAGLDLKSADVRLGIQQFAWGKLDGIPPTDVLNPRDLHDPFVADLEEAKIGIPALQASYYPPEVPRLALGDLRATLVYVPLAVPSRLALLEERWFPQGARPPSDLSVPKDDVELPFERTLLRQCAKGTVPRTLCDPAVDVIVGSDVHVGTTLRTANRRPPLRLDAGGIGARLAGSWRGMDWDLYHYSGPEVGPNADLEATVVIRDFQINPESPRRIDIHKLRARNTIRQAHSTIHMTGADWSSPLGGATVRAEAAFFQDRPYLRVASGVIDDALKRLRLPGSVLGQALDKGCTKRRPCRFGIDLGELFPASDSVEWGAGVDYLVHGVFSLVQVNQIILLDSAPRLIIADPETRLTALVRRRFLQERLELELRSTYSLERGGWFAFPRVSYLLTDDLRVRVGYLALGGSRNSLIGQFGRNDEVVMQVRYSY